MGAFLTVSAVIIVVLLIIINVAPLAPKPKPKPIAVENQVEVTQPVTEPQSFQIQGVPIVSQNELKAGCETYACTMLLQILGFQVDEFTIADNTDLAILLAVMSSAIRFREHTILFKTDVQIASGRDADVVDGPFSFIRLETYTVIGIFSFRDLVIVGER